MPALRGPEDLREVISAYQKCVAETVQRFGGFVAKYMGDGVLVYLKIVPDLFCCSVFTTCRRIARHAQRISFVG